MSSPATSGVSLKPPTAPVIPFRKSPRQNRVAFLIGVGFFVLVVLLYSLIWPFSQESVVKDLSEASESTVTLAHFRSTFFPNPGCVIDDVQFQRGPNHFTFITIQKLTIQGSYTGILRRHVRRIIAAGAHVFFPAFGTGTAFTSLQSKTVIDEVVADGAVVEFASNDSPNQPLTFDLHRATLRGVKNDAAIRYELKFHNPNPDGEIAVSGAFGPWPTGHPEDIPLSGKYTLEQGDLGDYGGIGGHFDSSGNFRGPLKHIQVSGTTQSNDFQVKSSHHATRLNTHFDAYVDAMHGDTFLNQVEAQLAHSIFAVKGSVAGARGKKGKFTQLEISSRQGRIEDMLGLFVTSPYSPMSGPVSLRTRVQIPSGEEPFLRRVQLNGEFGVNEGSFSNSSTQTDVDKLSAGARGENKENPQNVLTDLKGRVTLTNGLAQFSDLSFTIPGAHARLQGTYNILNYKIDLHGRMRVDSQISHTTSGPKAVLLKLMDPFFKKKKKGEVVPVHIGGTYEHPQFGLDLDQQKSGQPVKAAK